MNELTSSIAVTSLVVSGVFNAFAGLTVLFNNSQRVTNVYFLTGFVMAAVGIVSVFIGLIF